ncbi:hypothetical protein MNEG_0203 [Monoraphidium neglectum]|uniref:Uncharacterized protein n=1 Tax=Monoraphidium neglectum TaxID=145388 RepID=A0A0D2KCG5_9CHLO|nr:hypothetical protein MNEG_0203 [Monoraphidium neglectum]KIZ07758.1 hypothetical protein MNEG_0203 [Monoraphidium neglectum]|eukprot:XP_013906777.1 hypothetical protein MNEG_0203 [Monoraphidium neglectum]
MSLAPKPTCRWIIRTRPAHGVAASHLQRAATRQRNRGARWAGVAGAAGQGAPGRDESCKDYDMAAPGLANPNAPWGFFTANEFDDGTMRVKKSLTDLGTGGSVTAFSLNCIKAIHWLSFPLGFWVAGFIVVHADKILPLVGNDPVRHYLLVLSVLTQVFGGGITGNMMHEYESWQVAPFRNPLTLQGAVDDAVAGCKTADERLDCVLKRAGNVYVGSYNNAWLRAVAYRFLFFFQSLAIALSSVGALGLPTGATSSWLQWLAAGMVPVTVFVGLIGPFKPVTQASLFGQPLGPLPVVLLGSLVVNFFIGIPAATQLFGASLAAAWPPTAPLPVLAAGAAALGGLLFAWRGALVGAAGGALLLGAAQALPWTPPLWLLSILPIATIAGGGLVEGFIAETTCDQWWHWRAFVILTLGFGMLGLYYWHLVFP